MKSIKDLKSQSIAKTTSAIIKVATSTTEALCITSFGVGHVTS